MRAAVCGLGLAMLAGCPSPVEVCRIPSCAAAPEGSCVESPFGATRLEDRLDELRASGACGARIVRCDPPQGGASHRFLIYPSGVTDWVSEHFSDANEGTGRFLSERTVTAAGEPTGSCPTGPAAAGESGCSVRAVWEVPGACVDTD